MGSFTDAFDYELPPERIAQEPIEPRDAARLLIDWHDHVDHRTVADLAAELMPGDVLVVNDTRVLSARLPLAKETGGRVEVLLLTPVGGARWEALVRGGRRVKPGTVLVYDGRPAIEVGEALSDGRRLLDVLDADIVEAAGQVPLPPYIDRPLADPERYQTVFARRPASVAAPTAGLHLTPDLLARIQAAGIDVVAVELEVGLGTFRPITADRVADHVMHAERYRVADDVWSRIERAERVVAVGTTVVRTLESVAASGALAGSTDLFIRRGFEWRCVDALLTNFHVPRSSLLVMIDAFIGDRWRDLYAEALAGEYRFLSLGDAMFLTRRHAGFP